MPDRCVMGGCSGENDPERKILFSFTELCFFCDYRIEAKARRIKWVDLVKLKREIVKWEPTGYSPVCSLDFSNPHDFEAQLLNPSVKRRLEITKDVIGTIPVPRFYRNSWEDENYQIEVVSRFV